MATGNLFLGTARRKVGDVVLYRRNGQQVSRVRVRSIANPKSAGQALQRVYFAPVSKFYSPLSATLEQSWEGLNRSASADAFRRQAINDARFNGWYLPKGQGFFPLPYRVTNGTLMPLVNKFGDLNILLASLGAQGEGAAVPATVGDLSALFIAAGYSAGDQITLIGVIRDDEGNFSPVANRFLLAPESTVTVADALPNFTLLIDAAEDGNEYLGFFVKSGYDTVAGVAIVSRWENNKWRRSTQRMIVDTSIMDDVTSAEAKIAAIESYQDSAAEITSDVYLNGSTGTDETTLDVIAMDDGTAFTPVELNTLNPVAIVRGNTGSGSITFVNVKFGDQYLLNKTTKGPLPEGSTAQLHFLDGNNASVKAWLMSQGVAASVFQ